MPDENATYILEPVTNEEYYQVRTILLRNFSLKPYCFQDDQNIMWIQETVEVEQVVMQQSTKKNLELRILFCVSTAGELRLAAQRGDHPQPQRDGERGADAGSRDEP